MEVTINRATVSKATGDFATKKNTTFWQQIPQFYFYSICSWKWT